MRVVNVIHTKNNNFISHMTRNIHSLCCKPDIQIGFSPNIKTNPLVIKNNFLIVPLTYVRTYKNNKNLKHCKFIGTTAGIGRFHHHHVCDIAPSSIVCIGLYAKNFAHYLVKFDVC